MASQDIKEFLFEQTGVAATQWKRLSKKKTPQGEIRIFENKAGTQVETLESPDGVLLILEAGSEPVIKQVKSTEPNDKANLKKAKSLVIKYLENGTEPNEKNVGYAFIPSLFKFSFMEDANSDHTEHLEMAAIAGDKRVVVTGFNIFISPKDNLFKDYSFDHLEPLLYPFLPVFMDETEESSFCIHVQTQGIYDEERFKAIDDGTIPKVPYDRFVSTMEAAGFEYDASTCMLAKLGGSQGAEPIAVEKFDGNVEFSMIVVKHQWMPLEDIFGHDFIMKETSPDEKVNYITALAIKSPNYKTRSAQEKLITGTLQKYCSIPPGRICNAQLPQLELFCISKKGHSTIDMLEEDRQAVYNILVNQGWSVNNSLVDQDKNWTYEQWAIEPFQDSIIPLGDKSFTDIDFTVWEAPNKKPKLI